MPLFHQWLAAGKRYYPLSLYLRQVFGGPVRKISVDAGFGCPNRDGTLGRGGCIFCNPESYCPNRRAAGPPRIAEQIGEAAERFRRRSGTEQFLAYFQPGSNTYGPPARLRASLQEALQQPGIVGIVVGTRPDCLAEGAMDVLAEFAPQTWLTVELGLQSIHEASLAWMRRRHGYSDFLEAVGKCRDVGVRVGAHVILGLPGESAEHIHATAHELARLGIDAVKLHNLHAVKDTELAEMVAAGSVHLPAKEDYVSWVVDFLECLHPECVVDRLSADAPRDLLVGPAWCAEKGAVLADIEAEFMRRDTCQGARCRQ
ncbi:MAG: TIGR01212 family radical SAM protein [Thermoguttaceae bacterium]|jgi:radical SAM protein (TIGR01212 family)|nr:TIGR01212 family radical SAM protein [Thermoguttaceae bacterium]